MLLFPLHISRYADAVWLKLLYSLLSKLETIRNSNPISDFCRLAKHIFKPYNSCTIIVRVLLLYGTRLVLLATTGYYCSQSIVTNRHFFPILIESIDFY